MPQIELRIKRALGLFSSFTPQTPKKPYVIETLDGGGLKL